ncbi:MAG: hypothetical protein ABIX44_00790 [Cryobacterium sp.]
MTPALRKTSGTAPTLRDESALLGRWVVWVAVGESLGFLAPALAWLSATLLNPAATVPALVAAGAAEGALLGWAQARVLKRRIPALSAPRWIGGTALAASLAWLIGELAGENPSVWQAWPVGAQIGVGVPAGALLLCSVGFAQWLELRRHLPRSGWWVAGSAAAWCLGLAVFLGVASPLWQPGQPLPLVIMIGVLAAILMAVSMALATGLVLVRLLRRAA